MKAVLSWSGGKDSALCLLRAKQQKIPVAALLTAVSKETQCIAGHEVPVAFIRKQAEALSLPLIEMYQPYMPSNAEYDARVRNTYRELTLQGYTHIIFGDIFLEDLKQYREQLIAGTGLTPLFPLWQEEPAALIQEWLSQNYTAITVAVNGNLLPADFCGRQLNAAFFKDLPAGMDPCGENGSYHSFVTNGPFFNQPLSVAAGSVRTQKIAGPGGINMNFYFCSLLDISLSV